MGFAEQKTLLIFLIAEECYFLRIERLPISDNLATFVFLIQ